MPRRKGSSKSKGILNPEAMKPVPPKLEPEVKVVESPPERPKPRPVAAGVPPHKPLQPTEQYERAVKAVLTPKIRGKFLAELKRRGIPTAIGYASGGSIVMVPVSRLDQAREAWGTINSPV